MQSKKEERKILKFNKTRGSLIGNLTIFGILTEMAIDYKVIYANKLTNPHLKRFYKSFFRHIPDHPNPHKDFFLFTWGNILSKKDSGFTNVYFICQHFECTELEYILKLVKICKKLQQKAQAHVEIAYVSGNYEKLIIRIFCALNRIVEQSVLGEDSNA